MYIYPIVWQSILILSVYNEKIDIGMGETLYFNVRQQLQLNIFFFPETIRLYSCWDATGIASAFAQTQWCCTKVFYVIALSIQFNLALFM